MLEAKAHGKPSMQRKMTKRGPSQDVAKKMLADNPVDYQSLPVKVGQK
jgi:hypothetical protein